MNLLGRIILALAVSSAAFAQLTGSPDKDSRNVLEAGLKGDVDTRRELAVALSLISRRDPSAKLLDILVKDGDHLVREAAFDSLGELGDKTKASIARVGLSDDVPEVVFAAARAMYRLDPAQSRPVLLSILNKETDAKSNFFSSQFRSLLRSMKTPKSALLLAARGGSFFIPVPGMGTGISAMSSMLLDSDFSARAYALTLLSHDGPKSAATAKLLRTALTDDDWSVRAAAVQAIANGGLTGLAKDLVPLFDDRDKKVRYRASAAWVRLQYLARPKR